MTGSRYLSELVDMNTIQKGRLNIITAPTGSGKSYFALQHIPSQVYDPRHHVVYLIDTINGREQIVQNYSATSEYYGWSKEIEEEGMWFEPDGKVVVLTYAKFGYLLQRFPDFQNLFSFIICDEIHNLIKFQFFSPRPNLHSRAREGLEKAVKDKKATVIALTATPSSISKKFFAPSAVIPIDQTDLIQYETKEIIPYANLESVLSNIEAGAVSLCYLTHISQMEDVEKYAKDAGFSPICIWSTKNQAHPMSQAQLDARESILRNFTIPSQYDFLIINSSSETSIKIKSHVDYVIVHNQNSDTQIPVRGRVNSDLERLYLASSCAVPLIEVPEEYLGKRLFTEEKRALCANLNLRNPKNSRPYQWTKIKEFLIENDYYVEEGRYDSKRYAIIQLAGNT